MTLGIDVSRLFTEMVLSIETRDLVVKKMVYHYLCTYAHEKPEMGLMCINTLQRDCSNDDPMVGAWRCGTCARCGCRRSSSTSRSP